MRFLGFTQREFTSSDEALEAVMADGAAVQRAKKFGTDSTIWESKREHAKREFVRLSDEGK